MKLTGTQFEDLNDDCLREILTLVTVMDLCSLLELFEISRNFRLKEITSEIFKKQHNICDLNRMVDSVDEAQRLLENFGPLISDLTAKYSGEDGVQIIKLIIRFCSDTLKSLDIWNFSLNDIGMTAVFHKLEILSIVHCDFQGDSVDLFAHCNSLLKLIVDIARPEKAILKQTFPKLETFGVEWDGNSCKSFLSRHKKLKALALSISDHLEIFPFIAENCSELTKFWILRCKSANPEENEIAFKSISSMKYLQQLRLSANPNSLVILRELCRFQSLKSLILDYISFGHGVVSVLIQLKCLEQLCIYLCEEVKDLNCLTELWRLIKLQIVSNENIDFDLVRVVSRLTNLRFMFLQLHDFTIDEKMHSRIMNARSKVGKAHQSLQIKCDDITAVFPSCIS